MSFSRFALDPPGMFGRAKGGRRGFISEKGEAGFTLGRGGLNYGNARASATVSVDGAFACRRCPCGGEGWAGAVDGFAAFGR